jgi:hypothetical protein
MFDLGIQFEGRAGARLFPDPVKEHSTCVNMKKRLYPSVV